MSRSTTISPPAPGEPAARRPEADRRDLRPLRSRLARGRHEPDRPTSAPFSPSLPARRRAAAVPRAARPRRGIPRPTAASVPTAADYRERFPEYAAIDRRRLRAHACRSTGPRRSSRRKTTTERPTPATSRRYRRDAPRPGPSGRGDLRAAGYEILEELGPRRDGDRLQGPARAAQPAGRASS